MSDREERIRGALRGIVDPCSIATGVPISLEDMGLIKEVRFDGEVAVVTLQLTSPNCLQLGNILAEVERVAERSPELGAIRVDVDYRSEWLPSMMSESARGRLRLLRPLDDLGTAAR